MDFLEEWKIYTPANIMNYYSKVCVAWTGIRSVTDLWTALVSILFKIVITSLTN